MKRNLFPFLGIAFVVAIAATGVFYGLFVDKISGASPAAAASPAGIVVAARAVDRGAVLTAADLRLQPAPAERPEGAFGSIEEVAGRAAMKAMAADEPVTVAGLTGAKGVAVLSIPKGMRAISIRVADSNGLVPYLRPGNRIDVQSIVTQGGNEPQARTLLSNVEVLNVHADTSPQPAPTTILNLLVPAKDVERVALADSAAKVRIVLRNAEDREEVVVVPAAAAAITKAAAGTAAPAVGPMVRFRVRVAAAAADAARELAARAGLAGGGNGAVRIGLLPADWKAEELEKSKSLRILSTEAVESGQWREVSLQAGGASQNEYDLRLKLTPRGAANGMVRVRVRPELTLPERGGVSSRKFSADLQVADGQSVLVAGFERDASAPALIEKLFRTAAQPAGNELLLLVTPQLAAR